MKFSPRLLGLKVTVWDSQSSADTFESKCIEKNRTLACNAWIATIAHDCKQEFRVSETVRLPKEMAHQNSIKSFNLIQVETFKLIVSTYSQVETLKQQDRKFGSQTNCFHSAQTRLPLWLSGVRIRTHCIGNFETIKNYEFRKKSKKQTFSTRRRRCAHFFQRQQFWSSKIVEQQQLLLLLLQYQRENSADFRFGKRFKSNNENLDFGEQAFQYRLRLVSVFGHCLSLGMSHAVWQTKNAAKSFTARNLRKFFWIERSKLNVSKFETQILKLKKRLKFFKRTALGLENINENEANLRFKCNYRAVGFKAKLRNTQIHIIDHICVYWPIKQLAIGRSERIRAVQSWSDPFIADQWSE